MNKIVFCFILLIVSSFSRAEILTIGMGNFEPYFNRDTKVGIFTEVVEKVFAEMPDYKVKMAFGLSNRELWLSYEKRMLDGVTNVFDFKSDSCLTDPAFRFQDVAVTKRNSGLAITNLEDLKGRSIVTYEGAKTFWGSHFENIVSSAKYIEIKQPTRQALLLNAERVEVSIGDIFIFMHAVRSEPSMKLSDYSIHKIFPKKYSYMAFRDGKICESFNKALSKLKANGEYERIYDRHLSAYRNM